MSAERQKERRLKQVDKYVLMRTLGTGNFGKVKLARDTETGESVAVKVLEKAKMQAENMNKAVQREIAIMKILQHPSIVQLKDVLSSRRRIFVVVELVPGGELFTKIAAAGRLSEDDARRYFRQLMLGVEYCHIQRIAHRDIKPENLLLDADDNLKISDFGLSNLTHDADTLMHTHCGTPNYIAPEVTYPRPYDAYNADIWSCGVVLYVMLVGALPFDEKTMTQLFAKIRRARYTIPDFVPIEAADLIRKILVVDPEERYSISQILNHPWMQMDADRPEPAVIRPPSPVVSDIFRQGETLFEDAEAEAIDAFSLIQATGAMSIRPVGLSPSERVAGTMFMTQTDAQDIMMQVLRIAESKHMRVIEHSPNTFKLQLQQRLSPIQVLTFYVQVFSVAGGAHAVEFQRCQGDPLEFFKLYSEFQQQLS